MIAQSIDGLTKALLQCERAARSKDRASRRGRPPTICLDIGLLLAELRARRKRLRAWIRLLNAEMACRRSAGTPPRCPSRPGSGRRREGPWN